MKKLFENQKNADLTVCLCFFIKKQQFLKNFKVSKLIFLNKISLNSIRIGCLFCDWSMDIRENSEQNSWIILISSAEFWPEKFNRNKITIPSFLFFTVVSAKRSRILPLCHLQASNKGQTVQIKLEPGVKYYNSWYIFKNIKTKYHQVQKYCTFLSCLSMKYIACKWKIFDFLVGFGALFICPAKSNCFLLLSDSMESLSALSVV